MSAPWRLITPAQSLGLPPLLLATTFTTNSYTIYLTDLTSIWGESLDRRAIIRRSLDEDTSIDPSEDAMQLRLFLEKIQLGLDGGESTSLALSRTSAGLDLCVTATLPRGLKPLEWPIHLARSSQSELTAHLVIPLLRAQNARMREQDGLIRILHKKDHVIQKLVDILEATGADLGQVFPSATGKGELKLTRKLAEGRINGLGAFEVAEWRKKVRGEEMDAEDDEISEVVGGVFRSGYGSTLTGVTSSALPGSWDKWWDRISDSIQLSSLKRENAILVKTSPATRRNKEPADGEDDFQVQATPPHLARSPVNAKRGKSAEQPPAPLVINDTTDESDDLDALSQRSAVPDSHPLFQPKPQPRKLGAIGGPKPIHRPPSLSPPPATIVRRPKTPPPKSKVDYPVADDDETATEDEGGSDGPSQPSMPFRRPVSPPPLAKPKNPSGLLERTGRRRETEEGTRDGGGERPSAVATSPTHEARSPLEQKLKPQPSKLGIIGHSKAAASSSATYATRPAELGADGGRRRGAKDRSGHGVAREEGRDGSRDMVTGGREEREMSLELADRKRAELKRELAEKAKVPAKKKRKF